MHKVQKNRGQHTDFFILLHCPRPSTHIPTSFAVHVSVRGRHWPTQHHRAIRVREEEKASYLVYALHDQSLTCCHSLAHTLDSGILYLICSRQGAAINMQQTPRTFGRVGMSASKIRDVNGF